jgi:hypothetical protein
VAVNCRAVPSGIEVLAGVSRMATNTGGVTVSVVEPLTEPDVAVMVV